MKLGLKPRDSISGSPKKPLGGVEGGGRIYKNLCNKGQVAGTKRSWLMEIIYLISGSVS